MIESGADGGIERALFTGGSLLVFGLIVGGTLARRRVERVFGFRTLFAGIPSSQVSPHFSQPPLFFSYGKTPRSVSNIQRVDPSFQTFDLSAAGPRPQPQPQPTRYSQRVSYPSPSRAVVVYSTLALSQFASDIRIDIASDGSEGTQVKLVGTLVAPWLVANTALEALRAEEQSRMEAIENHIKSQLSGSKRDDATGAR